MFLRRRAERRRCMESCKPQSFGLQLWGSKGCRPWRPPELRLWWWEPFFGYPPKRADRLGTLWTHRPVLGVALPAPLLCLALSTKAEGRGVKSVLDILFFLCVEFLAGYSPSAEKESDDNAHFCPFVTPIIKLSLTKKQMNHKKNKFC